MKLGEYEIVGEVGRGGAGIVFEGRAPDGARVAVKLIQRLDPEGLARFDRERRLLVRLGREEGFVPFIDAGTSDRGLFLVMPFVSGGTLRDKLRTGPLALEEAVEIARAIARAVGRAHERGIVHRDLKPSNVLFDESGRPLVADLGLAKHFRADAPGASQSVALSKSSESRGTWGYMPPEQMQDARKVGPRADVFALGAILYECLGGQPAFDGDTVMEVIEKVTRGELVPLRTVRPDLPASIADVVDRALSAKPEDRYEDGHAFALALGGSGTTSSKKRALVAVGLVVAAALAAWIVASSGPSPKSEPAIAAPSMEAGGQAPRLRPPSAGGKLVPPPIEPPKPEPPKPAPEPPKPEKPVLPPLVPEDSDAAMDARRFVDSARDHLARGDLKAARQAADRAIEADKKSAWAWILRGKARSPKGKGEFREAIADFTTAIDLDPRIADAWSGRAMCRHQAGELGGALADATRAIELDPRNEDAWFSRGKTKWVKKDQDGAFADWDRAIEIDPRDPLPLLARATARKERRELAPAKADLDRVLELNARDTNGLFLRGTVRRDLGDTDGAIDDLEACVLVSPGYSTAWEKLAEVYDKKGAATAIARYQRLLSLLPRDEPAAVQVQKRIDELRARR